MSSLDDYTLKELQLIRDDFESLKSTPKTTYVSKLVESELKKVIAYMEKVEQHEEEHKELQKTAKATTDRIYSQISKFAFEDGEKNVKIYITDLVGIGAHDSSKISCKFTETTLDLKIDSFDKKNLRLFVPELFGKINAETSKFTIKSNSLSITLTKSGKSKWKDIRKGSGDEKLGGGMPGMGMPGMGGMGGMPGMGGMEGMDMANMGNMFGGGDDEGMGGLLGDEEGMGGGPGGAGANEGMMEMMKKMYEEGDENTRKMMDEAMAKSQQDATSGAGGIPL